MYIRLSFWKRDYVFECLIFEDRTTFNAYIPKIEQQESSLFIISYSQADGVKGFTVDFFCTVAAILC